MSNTRVILHGRLGLFDHMTSLGVATHTSSSIILCYQLPRVDLKFNMDGTLKANHIPIIAGRFVPLGDGISM